MKNKFIGAWRLISCEIRDEDGTVFYPYGENVVGYLMYTHDGYMSAVISDADRANFSSQDIKGGTVEEKAKAAETYLSYAGKYEMHGNMVIHHLDVSLFPNWVGTEQKRFVELSGNKLIISTEPFLISGKHQAAHLIWEKA